MIQLNRTKLVATIVVITASIMFFSLSNIGKMTGISMEMALFMLKSSIVMSLVYCVTDDK